MSNPRAERSVDWVARRISDGMDVWAKAAAEVAEVIDGSKVLRTMACVFFIVVFFPVGVLAWTWAKWRGR